jgi:hypothetical protein
VGCAIHQVYDRPAYLISSEAAGGIGSDAHVGMRWHAMSPLSPHFCFVAREASARINKPSLRMRFQEPCVLPLVAGVHIHPREISHCRRAQAHV